MPTPVLKSLAKKAGITMDKAEKLWDTAKKVAKKAGKEKDYAYITGIWKKSAKVESVDIIDSLIDSVLEGNSPSLDEVLMPTGAIKALYSIGPSLARNGKKIEYDISMLTEELQGGITSENARKAIRRITDLKEWANNASQELQSLKQTLESLESDCRRAKEELPS